MSNHAKHYRERGWCHFARDAKLSAWIAAALPAARGTLRDPAQARWLRYQGTWFAGVNALPNRADGSVDGSGPLQAEVVDFIAAELGQSGFAWDRAQVSICYPGYPRPMAGESAARVRFRAERDAAHVDGLLPVGERRRRHVHEYHGFILGIPLVEFDANASPFVVWEGSHEIIRAAFVARFAGIAPQQWRAEDVTETYHAARDRVFAECSRVEIHARPGEAFLAHRLVVHGMAPWREGARASEDGRMICYFRPETLTPYDWLHDPWEVGAAESRLGGEAVDVT